MRCSARISPLVACTVSADADLAQIKALLVHGQEEGWWHFEVSCVTDAWRDVPPGGR